MIWALLFISYTYMYLFYKIYILPFCPHQGYQCGQQIKNVHNKIKTPGEKHTIKTIETEAKIQKHRNKIQRKQEGSLREY